MGTLGSKYTHMDTWTLRVGYNEPQWERCAEALSIGIKPSGFLSPSLSLGVRIPGLFPGGLGFPLKESIGVFYKGDLGFGSGLSEFRV